MAQALKQISLDDDIAHAIMKAVIASVRETFGVEVTAGKAEFGEGMVSLVGDVSGIIGMVQQQLEGTLLFSMTQQTVHDILPKIVGENTTITHEMVVDTVGELTNMVFGQVKNDLNQRGHNIKLGIPCVVSGKGHFVCQFHRGKYMIVPFQLKGQLFQVYVALHEGGAAPLTNVG